MLATSLGGFYFRDERCENTGRFYVTERGPGYDRVFLRESLRLRHLAFHRKYLFYGRWHGSLTFAAAATPPGRRADAMLRRKLHTRERKNFIHYAVESNNRVPCSTIFIIRQFMNQIALLVYSYNYILRL